MEKDWLSESFRKFEKDIVNPSKLYGGYVQWTCSDTPPGDSCSGTPSKADDCYVDECKDDSIVV